MKKYIFGIILIVTLIGIIIINKVQNLDVIGKESINSFSAVIKKLENNIESDNENGGWSLTAPDGSIRFIWSRDFSGSAYHDVMMEFSSQPFINAGLDVSKLPEGMVIDDMIMVGTTLGDEKFKYENEATPLSSYEKIVELKRENIQYHAAFDHYGIDISNGNMFEWAADMATNDKDIVFVLDPTVFTQAGVDAQNVEGWIYAKIPIMKDGKKVEVYKFLKPFNIE